MGIISSKIIEDHLQTYGMRQVREEHIDHLGRKHYHAYEAQKDANIEKIMLNRVSQIENSLISAELAELIKKVESGERVGSPEFCLIEDVKIALLMKKTENLTEITNLTTKNTFLEIESEVK